SQSRGAASARSSRLAGLEQLEDRLRLVVRRDGADDRLVEDGLELCDTGLEHWRVRAAQHGQVCLDALAFEVPGVGRDGCVAVCLAVYLLLRLRQEPGAHEGHDRRLCAP